MPIPREAYEHELRLREQGDPLLSFVLLNLHAEIESATESDRRISGKIVGNWEADFWVARYSGVAAIN
jgi:hypothetical protein